MKSEDSIFVDHSTLSTFLTCNEKCRLRYVENYIPRIEGPPRVFGRAIHSGIREFYKSKGDLSQAEKAFLAEAEKSETKLPIETESDEKRSLERGISIIHAYTERWKNEPFEIISPSHIEVGFACYLMDFKGRPVVYVGSIDRMMRSKLDGKVYNFETKTTAQGLGIFADNVRPNHQITGYHWAAKSLLDIEFAGTYWDCIFVSSRKPDPKKGGWFSYGIDIEKDFLRRPTDRSRRDVDEFISDIKRAALHYLTLREDDSGRWIRNTSACRMYGGCDYIPVCSTNVNEAVLKSEYIKKEWKPWNIRSADQSKSKEQSILE